MPGGGSILLGGVLDGAQGFLSEGLLGDEPGGPAGVGLTAFDARVDLDQGRLARRPTAGDYAFVLGSTLANRIDDLAPGDYVQIDQVVDVTGIDFVRFDLDLYVPRSTPEDTAWVAALILDGSEVVTVPAWRGLRRRPSDVAINVCKLVGEHTIGVRLRLAEV